MIIVDFFSDTKSEMNTVVYRSVIPSNALRKAGHCVTNLNIRHWIKQTREARLACVEADVIIIQRTLFQESISFADYWRQRGKTVILDFDDAYQLIEKHNTAYKFWGAAKVDVESPEGEKTESALNFNPVDQLRLGMGKVSGATMPSRILAQDWKPFGRTYYQPNYFDTSLFKVKPEGLRFYKDRIIIGWGGSTSHWQSFEGSGIVPAISSLIEEFPEIIVLIVGDKRIHDALPFPSTHKTYLPYVKWYEWPMMIHRFDIGIAPMYGRYDDSRSHIKTCEYVLAGIPFVASISPAFYDFREVGMYATGGDSLKQEDFDQRALSWKDRLTKVITDLEGERKSILAKRHLALRWDAYKNVSNITNLYKQIKTEADSIVG